MSAAAISIRELGLGFGQHAVLDQVSFDVPSAGVTTIMGPGGGGKSALLRTLARRNQKLPSFWHTGDVVLADGRSLLSDVAAPEVQRRVPLLAQKAALYTASVLDNVIDAVRDPRDSMTKVEKTILARQVLQPVGLWSRFEDHLDEPVLSLAIGDQRLISLARLIAARPWCLLADEPFRDLSDDAAAAIRELLLRWSAEHAVVLVEHNLKVARDISTKVVLLAGGQLIADQPTRAFFDEPTSELAQQFLRSGSCWPEESPPEPPPQPRLPPAPRGFHWIIENQLAGTQLPGLLGDRDTDMTSLRALGCRHLVSLTLRPIPPEEAARHNMQAYHFPIEDMRAPSPVAAEHLCRKIAGWLEAGEPTVLHCRAGLGRTGTMLACYLVSRGATPVSAVHEVRSVNPYYIQSFAQLDFIDEFHAHVHAAAKLSTCKG